MLRELDERTSGNLRITLYWDDGDDALIVAVDDFTGTEPGHALTGISPADAKLAFEHPFGYAPRVAVGARV